MSFISHEKGRGFNAGYRLVTMFLKKATRKIGNYVASIFECKKCV